MKLFTAAATLMSTLPACSGTGTGTSMCCVGDWTVSPGPYTKFDTSKQTAAENQARDVGCKTCCQGYNDGTKFGRPGTDLVFEVAAPGTFTAGYGVSGGAVAGGATLKVDFSQVQARLGANSVDTVYKRSTFDPVTWNKRTNTCAEGHAPGFRFGTFPISEMLGKVCTNAAGVVLSTKEWKNMFCNDGKGLNDGAKFDACFKELITLFGAYSSGGDSFACQQRELDSVNDKCRGQAQMCQGMVPSLVDGVLVSGKPDIEFEQDMVWKNEDDGLVIGQDWGMQKVFIGAQTVPGGRDDRCFHTDEDKMKGCTDTAVSENGIKFQLELNQNGMYPHGNTTYWDACTADGGNDGTCATCFAVAVTVDAGKFTVSNHASTGDAVSWTLKDASSGDAYDFVFAFESLYNRNGKGPSNFAKATVVTTTEDKSGSVHVCALKRDFDPSVSNPDVRFLYDPEVRVTKTAATSTPSASPTTSAPTTPGSGWDDRNSAKITTAGASFFIVSASSVLVALLGTR